VYFIKFTFYKVLFVFSHPVINLEQRFFCYILIGIIDDLLVHEKLGAAIYISESFAAAINRKVENSA